MKAKILRDMGQGSYRVVFLSGEKKGKGATISHHFFKRGYQDAFFRDPQASDATMVGPHARTPEPSMHSALRDAPRPKRRVAAAPPPDPDDPDATDIDPREGTPTDFPDYAPSWHSALEHGNMRLSDYGWHSQPFD